MLDYALGEGIRDSPLGSRPDVEADRITTKRKKKGDRLSGGRSSKPNAPERAKELKEKTF
jgi:hypothetical protein